MIKAGFIGLGAISNEHILGYLDTDDAVVVAVCDTDAKVGARWLDKWGLPDVKFYTDYREMLRDETLDLVEVLAPHHLHCEMVQQCAMTDIRAVSVQKPMGRNLLEADRMIEVCRDNGVMLRVFENVIYYPVYRKAKEIIKSGLIGEPIYVRSHTIVGIREGSVIPEFWSGDSWRTDLESSGVGPIVGDHGYHRFSLVQWLLDREIDTVDAWIDPETPLDCPAFVRARFVRGAGERARYAQIDFTFVPRMAMPCEFWLDDFVEVVGERGVMWINQCDGAGDREIYRDIELSSSGLFPPIAVFVDGKVNTYLDDMSLPERNWSSSFREGTRDMIRALVDDHHVPMYSGEQAKMVKRCSIAAYLSAEEGREVSIDEITSEAEASGRARIATNFCNI